MTSCCGICIYGKNDQKFTDSSKVECMINGYQAKLKSDSCGSFKRDFSKQVVVKSIHDAKKGR